MKHTFIEYLTEFDQGDHQLQTQQRQKQDALRQDQHDQNTFKDKMADASPQVGDIIIVKANKYLVRGGDKEGIVVKRLGQSGGGKIPHGTEFQNVGVNPKNGKNIFKATIQ